MEFFEDFEWTLVPLGISIVAVISKWMCRRRKKLDKEAYVKKWSTIVTLSGFGYADDYKFVGAKRVGKTSFAEALVRNGTNVIEVPLARPLKEFVYNVVPCEDSDKKDTVALTMGTKFTKRQLFEHIGDELRNVNPEIWCDKAVDVMYNHLQKHHASLKNIVNVDFNEIKWSKDIPGPHLVFVVSDVRFDNERQYWKKKFDSREIVIMRRIPDAKPFDPKTDHPSNAWPKGWKLDKFDMIIHNEILEELDTTARKELSGYIPHAICKQ